MPNHTIAIVIYSAIWLLITLIIHYFLENPALYSLVRSLRDMPRAYLQDMLCQFQLQTVLI